MMALCTTMVKNLGVCLLRDLQHKNILLQKFIRFNLDLDIISKVNLTTKKPVYAGFFIDIII